MTLPHVQLETLARQVCEGRRGVGSYDRKGCKRAHWRKRALAISKAVTTNPIKTALYRAFGWRV